MNRKVRKTFIGAFLATSLFIGVNSVSAVTIKETTSSDETAQLDKIKDNTFIIGTTKFESGVTVTAKKAIKAGSLYKDLYSQEADLYYYLAGEWSVYDENNKATPITDTEKLKELNEQAIYYVDNGEGIKEKMLEISYTKEIEDGYKFVFETDNAKKDSEVKYENNTIYVPATVKTLTVYASKDSSNTALDSFTRGEDGSSVFAKKSSEGTIAVTNESLANTVDNGNVIINGTVSWVNKTNPKTSAAGNFVSVKFTKPDAYENVNNAKIKITKNGDTVVQDTTTLVIANDYNLAFASKEDTYEIVITWDNGNIQTFNVSLGETAALALPPQGSIDKGNTTTGGTLTYTVNNNAININGALSWYKSNAAKEGLDAGNYAAVKISAPTGYTAENISDATIAFDNDAAVKWSSLFSADADTSYVYYPRFDSNTRSHKVVVTWEEGNTQEFVIALDDTATLAGATGGTIAKGDDTDTSNFVLAENKKDVTIKGEIKWYQASAIDSDEAGNYVMVNITAPDDYNNTTATIKVDDPESVGTSWSTNGNTTKEVELRFANKTDKHTIYVTWENGNTQEFTVSLDESATLASAAAGTIEVDSATSATSTYVPTGNKMIVNANENLLKWSKSAVENGNEAGNYVVVKITAPKTGYDSSFLQSNAKYKVDDAEDYTSWSDSNTYFTKYIKFATKSETHTITVEWEKGNTQVFNISLGETTELEAALAGTIALDNSVGGEKLVATLTEPNVLELDGTISYDKTKGNAFAYKITAPTGADKYSADNLNAANITINTHANNIVTTQNYTGEKLFAEGSFTIVREQLESNFQYDEIIIEWENGNTQTFKVVAKDTLTLEERPNYVTGISVKSEREGTDDQKLVIGNTLQLIATLTTEKEGDAANSKVTWTSSAADVVSVSESGVITALKYGTATITATSEDGSFEGTYAVSSVYPEMKTTTQKNVSSASGTKTVNVTFNTTGGSEKYTYTFTVKEKDQVAAVDPDIHSFDQKTNCLTLNITDTTKTYVVEYTIKDGVETQLKGSFEV